MPPPFHFARRTLDIIFASHVFQFVSDKEATLRGLARCLAPGGAIILTVGGAGIREALRGLVSEEQWSQLAWRRLSEPAHVSSRANGASPSRGDGSRGPRVEVRDAHFTVTWAGIVEWIDLRWGLFMDEEQRRIAARILDEMAPQLSSRSFDISDRLLIGRKPAL